jgi:hypothetical protein
MVVPVPVVLAEANVKTLDEEVFARVDRLAAPRLVEYWEQDPCGGGGTIGLGNLGTIGHGSGRGSGSGYGAGGLRVQVEAEFAVGEYDIVILSAQDSGDLDTWLRQNGYHIPDGAGAALAPYVQAGMKFFVAKVDVEKVTFEEGRAVLSPLRVHYQSEDFSLPIRLGMLNSSGTQDLIVHVLARNARYEAASYENVFVPTNLEVTDEVRASFGRFYAALFDKTLEENEGAVVTEYSWQATGCDPCPGPILSEQDLLTLGADVAVGGADEASTTAWRAQVRIGVAEIRGDISPEIVRRVARRHMNELRFCHETRFVGTVLSQASVAGAVTFTVGPAGEVRDPTTHGIDNEAFATCITQAFSRWRYPQPAGGVSRVTQPIWFNAIAGAGGPFSSFVLTRLHYRYGRGELGEDLVMRPAPPVEGGRGVGPANELPTGAEPSTANNFQGRYIIRHPWEGEITCEEPVRGMWGGPPPGQEGGEAVAATRLGTVPRGDVELASLLQNPFPPLGITQVGPAAEPEPTPPSAVAIPEATTEGGGCGGCAAVTGGRDLSSLAALSFITLLCVSRRKP